MSRRFRRKESLSAIPIGPYIRLLCTQHPPLCRTATQEKLPVVRPVFGTNNLDKSTSSSRAYSEQNTKVVRRYGLLVSDAMRSILTPGMLQELFE